VILNPGMSRAIVFLTAAFACGAAASGGSAVAATARPALRAASGNLVVNGSFERPVVASPCPGGGSANPTPGICTYFGGSTGITGWTVGSNSADVSSRAVWKPAAGHQSIDLSGDGPGSLTQAIRTTPGARYILRWAVAGNGDCGQKVKSMVVYWNGAIAAALNFSTSGHGPSKMGWSYHQVRVKAVTSRSKIEFADATADQSLCGATLDNVSLKRA
jgi:choice-of-anchor C domain-containing protein